VTSSQTIAYLAVWGIVGCLIFSLFVVVAFRSGLVWTARDRDGTLKRRIPLRGCLAMSIIPAGLLGLQLAANDWGLRREGLELDFWSLWLLNFGHYLVLFVYDTAVIDGLVLGVWRPGFLQLTDEIGQESMRQHILVSIPVGLVAGTGMTAISTGLSLLVGRFAWA
jgi:hypothetical protein